MFSEDSFIRRHKIVSILILIVILIVGFLGYRMKGPYRYYSVDYVKTGQGEPGTLEVGVARRDITPNLDEYDTYVDSNDNNRYEPDKGETYNDRNGNGKFDAVWMAGFNSNRPAKSVHDPLWARAVAFRNNGLTLVMVAIDSIGIFHQKFIEVRKSLDPSLKIDHVVLSSMHDHEAPDTMGIWSGPSPYTMLWNYDDGYMKMVQRACKDAIEEAVKNLQPADMYCVPIEITPEGFVDDSRQPTVYDKTISAARFTKAGTDETIATMVNWGNHPETLGGSNPSLTSDFSNYWREGLEKGVADPNGAKGFGGTAVYFQGMVGGLMTQLHTTVPHRNGIDKFEEGSFEKAEALGDNLAILTLNALRGPAVWKNEKPRLTIAAKTIYVPMAGMYKVAMAIGLIHPGIYWGFKARTEVDAIRIGDVEIATIPGELYPEIAEGGVEEPEGQDFKVPPLEVPPLRASVMKGKMNMVIGLANDEIGYIIPKSQWDKEPPHAYKANGQYGEENSGGPDVAPAIHHESMALLERLHKALGIN